MKTLLVLLGLAAALAAAGCLLIYLVQGRLLYPAPNLQPPATLPAGVTRLSLEAGYGLLLSPPGTRGKRPLLIFTHGNGETASMWLQAFAPFLARGIAVLLVEYPGYGGAAGRPSLQSIRRTMLSAYDTAAALPDIDARRIVAYGRSVGGGAAALLARERPLAALGLESTFSTMAKLVAEKGMPAFLLRDRYDNVAALAALEIPVFLYHGERDTLIPPAHSRALREAARDAVLVTANCGHNDCPRPWRELLAFLTEKLALPR